MDVLANHYREQAAALMIARHAIDAAQAQQWCAFANDKLLLSRVTALLQLSPEVRSQQIAEQLARLQTAEQVVLMSEIHPSWLVDLLRHESPRVIGVLLRLLPSRHARFVVEHLPAHVRERLPHVIEAFVVDDQVLRIVRRRFEANFLAVPSSAHIEELTFATLFALTHEELCALFHDLGVQELAMALGRLEPSALRVLLNRLEFSDAKALRHRMAHLGDIDPFLTREAQYSILELSLEKAEPSTLLQEIGIQAFAKALEPAHLGMVACLRQKLPPPLAYLLQREVDMQLPNHTVERVRARQAIVMQRVGCLIRENIIDAKWWRALPVEVRQAVASQNEITAATEQNSVSDAPQEHSRKSSLPEVRASVLS